MKRLLAFTILSVALAIGMTGCASGRLQQASVKQIAITAAVITGVVLMATTYECANCNIGIEPQAARP